MGKASEDLDRRIHDQMLASDVHSLTEDYWSKYGNRYENPYGSLSAASKAASISKGVVESAALGLYFKGSVSEERVQDSNVVVAGAGIAICDPKGQLLFDSKKILEASHGGDGQMISREEADFEALLEGLNRALAFGFYKIVFFCDENTIFDYVSNTLPPRNAKIAALVNQVALLRRKFTYCSPSLVAPDDVKFVYKSAREVIFSQINWSKEAVKGNSFTEACIICFEDTNLARMFTVDGCLHRYCFSCMKKHVEAKLHNGQIAKCPHDGCNSELTIDRCAKFLPPDVVEVMSERIKESAIPVTEKVYCPDPKCSALMSKNEVLEYTKTSFIGAEQFSARKCIKCQKFFCLSCKVPWHHTMTCNDYRRENPHSHEDEQTLKSLATKKRWRQCANCNHMVELSEGCSHIICRCNYEFCYTCGAEWNNKKRLCTCPLWDEGSIIPELQLPQQRLPHEALPELEQELHQLQLERQEEVLLLQLQLRWQELQDELQLQQRQLQRQQLQLQQGLPQLGLGPGPHQQQQGLLQLALGLHQQKWQQHLQQRQLQHRQIQQYLRYQQQVLPQLALRLQQQQLPQQQVLLGLQLQRQQQLQRQVRELLQLQHQPRRR